MSEVGQDSSMEDILASIKRVIAEDPKPASVRGTRPRADVDEPDEDDILELDASLIQTPEPEAPLLVSDGAMEATRNSLAALTALRPSAGAISDESPLEAVVRDMLRPMLKDWLDQRLPEIVEQLVAREVARITGGR